MNPRYLIDTNICIYIMRHNPPAVRAQFARHPASALAMSIITLGELCFGVEKSQVRERACANLERLQEVIAVHALPPGAGIHYGQIRAKLQAQGQTIGNNDLWLAAHARAEGWILVSNNEREFARVEGLQLENWVSG